jgi:hypothetical protein
MEQAGSLATTIADDFTFGRDINFAFDEDKGIYLEYKDGKEASLNKDAIKSLAGEINMSVRYYEKTPAFLLVPHLNYYFRKAKEGLKARMFFEDGRAAALAMNPRGRFVSLPMVMDTFEEFLGKENIVGYHKPYFTWEKMIINIVLNEEFEVVHGDPLNIGLRYIHNFADLKPGVLSAYTFRQWCANGATTEDNLSSWKIGDGEKFSFRKWVPSVVVEAREALGKEQNRLRKLLEIPTGSDTSEILDHILEDRNVPTNVREEVRDAALNNHVENLYDVYNSMSEVATHSDIGLDHPRAIAQLEKAASGLAFHSELCPVCHHKK